MNTVPLLVGAALLLATGSAWAADPVTEPGPRNALSIHPFALSSHGVAIQYERYLVPRHWSLALGLGFRSSSRGNYSSWVTSVGIEPRYWLLGNERSERLGSDAMVGPFASLRVDSSWMSMTDTHRDRWVGGNVGVSVVGGLGWRFSLGHFELTPSFGLGSRTDFDPRGRLAPWTRAVMRLDWTVGVMF
ncbi:MAG: hypothetical protein R3B13_35015 [Polyangiaceae bacterium]